ncbi:MAG: hypothetical protein ABIR91_00620 [Candidatus Saccharimonadales bacterium]
MNKPGRHMDVVKPQSRPTVRRVRITLRQWIVWFGVPVIIVAATIGGYLHLQRNQLRINHDGYQVVYLTTGQIYFGHLQNTRGAYLTLTDVYTVQTDESGTKSAQITGTKLLKVSQQLYGPDNEMAIRSDHVQFWQNLSADSKITKAIASAP